MNEPLIVITDPPEIPKDERCPDCDAGKQARRRSMTYGPPHDVCGVCGHNFTEWTVKEWDVTEQA